MVAPKNRNYAPVHQVLAVTPISRSILSTDIRAYIAAINSMARPAKAGVFSPGPMTLPAREVAPSNATIATASHFIDRGRAGATRNTTQKKAKADAAPLSIHAYHAAPPTRLVT